MGTTEIMLVLTEVVVSVKKKESVSVNKVVILRMVSVDGTVTVLAGSATVMVVVKLVAVLIVVKEVPDSTSVMVCVLVKVVVKVLLILVTA